MPEQEQLNLHPPLQRIPPFTVSFAAAAGCGKKKRPVQIIVTEGLPWTNLALSSHDRHAEEPFPPLS
ncbi:MAG: hypothetical protein LIO64_06615 [Akkermansia sp.]|nr:hypothetical protein [Akkermansia sp.]